MRVRVRFRFNAESGEVELFQVDDLGEGLPLPDHDARHDRAAHEVARVIENNALVEEVSPDAGTATPAPAPVSRTSPGQGADERRAGPLHE